MCGDDAGVGAECFQNRVSVKTRKIPKIGHFGHFGEFGEMLIFEMLKSSFRYEKKSKRKLKFVFLVFRLELRRHG